MATVVADMNCTENAVVQLYHQRVQELTSVIVRSLPYLQRAAFRRMGNVADAEDAVQDALLSAYSHIDQFRGQARLSTWLTSIVINSARMTLRRQSRQLNVPLDEADQGAHCLLDIVSDPRPSPEEECKRAERAELLVQSLASLSPILRQAFQLRDIDGLSIRETAQALGVPNGTVKARLARARRKLKKLLQRGLGRHVKRCEASANHSPSRVNCISVSRI
jgi:RNA polymerase sigma-70 factor (ECF subfamily)